MQVVPRLVAQLLGRPAAAVLGVLGGRVRDGGAVGKELPQAVVRVRVDGGQAVAGDGAREGLVRHGQAPAGSRAAEGRLAALLVVVPGVAGAEVLVALEEAGGGGEGGGLGERAEEGRRCECRCW